MLTERQDDPMADRSDGADTEINAQDSEKDRKMARMVR
jgi:hypothetical protein